MTNYEPVAITDLPLPRLQFRWEPVATDDRLYQEHPDAKRIRRCHHEYLHEYRYPDYQAQCTVPPTDDGHCVSLGISYLGLSSGPRSVKLTATGVDVTELEEDEPTVPNPSCHHVEPALYSNAPLFVVHSDTGKAWRVID